MGLQGGTYDGWGQKSFLSDLCAPAAQRSSLAGVSKRCHSRGAGRRLTSAPTTREPLPSPTTPPLRMLLTHRKLLQSKAIAIENDLRASLRNFGLKVGMVGTAKFEARIKELVENLPDLAVLVEPLLIVRRALREQIDILHRRLLAIVRDDEVCRRLMTIPGVGPVVALTYRVTVDVPARFRNSKAVGAVFGLT